MNTEFLVKNRGLSITLRTALLSWLITILALFIFVAAIIPQQKRTFFENLDSKAQGVAVSLRDVAAGAAINEDFSSVVDHCKEMLNGDRSLEYIVITKNEGFSLILDRTGWRSENQSDEFWRPPKRESASGIGTVPLLNHRVFHYSQPFDYSGIEWGWIHVGLSLESYNRNVAMVYQRTGLLAIICIGVSLLASAIYAKRLVQPILALRKVVQKVAGGDLSARALITRGDELGSLASSVNSMTKALLRRDQILQSVRFAAQQFLSTLKWEDVIEGVLEQIGEAAAVDRIRVFEIQPNGAEGPQAEQRFLWRSPNQRPTEPSPAGPALILRASDFSPWIDPLSAGETVSIKYHELADGQLRPFEAETFKSALVIPIMVENLWWGTVTLAECDTERNWTAAERDSLRAAVDMLGAAITRQRIQDDLLRAKQAAEASSKAKSQFLANMSHEIRTPITGVLGMLQLLQRTELDKHQVRYANNAVSSAQALLTVIGNVLDFSKIEAGKMELEEHQFDPVEVVDTVVRLFAERAEDKGIELAYRVSEAVPRQLHGDSNRLRQILVNLVGNAVKFTHRGEVVVNCERQETSAETTALRFEIRDTGCGIAPEKQKLIFDPFAQADNSMARKYGGTGLGLTISRQFCELMGGSISVQSMPDQGATFVLTLSFRNDPSGTPGPAARFLDLRSLRVLVADDCATVRDINAEWIAAWKGEAEVAADATQVLEKLRSAARSGRAFQVAVLDWKMPGIDGLTLARLIKEDSELKSTGLVLLSSFTQQDGLDRIMAAGFAAFIPKPAGKSDLYDAIITAANGVINSAAPVAPEMAAALPAGARLGSDTILLAEDNEINREVATEIMSTLGYHCRWVRNGREAVQHWLRGGIDLILMDCQMPEMDGYEATRAIRVEEGRRPDHRHIPIVALTAHATKGDRDRCLEAGMDDYLTKPLDPQALEAMLAKWMRPKAAAEAAPVETAPAEPIDYPTLLRRCLNRQELAARLVHKLTAQADQDVQVMVAAARQNDAAALAASAHRLKGASANVAAEGLRRLAAELEALGRSGNLAAAGPLLEQLPQELVRLKNARNKLG